MRKDRIGNGGICVFIETMAFPLCLQNGENLVMVKKLHVKAVVLSVETISSGNSSQEKKNHRGA